MGCGRLGGGAPGVSFGRGRPLGIGCLGGRSRGLGLLLQPMPPTVLGSIHHSRSIQKLTPCQLMPMVLLALCLSGKVDVVGPSVAFG